ncbi:MAG: radical SAM protein, partial [Arenicella sp.]|nr:radical SAM protein [Arenicella sp.]
KLYRSLHQQQPERLDIKHNLGAVLLGLQQLREGARLLGDAINADPRNEGMLGSRKLLAMELYKNNFWEESIPWLIEAIQNDPDDAEVTSVLNRISPRTYLEPEKYDPLAAQTLKRYSPREADSYIYTIDIVGNCNLRCPSCPVGNSPDTGRFKKMMSLEVFTQVLQKIKAETPSEDPQIWLYNWGEPLLHPRLPDMVRAIRQAGFRSYLSSNLNIEKGLKELIKAKPDELKNSLSGFDVQSYESTHTKGDIHLVKSNFYRLRKYIDQYKSPTRVWVGHHIYKNNFHQVDQVRALCEELGFEHHPTQAFYQPLEKLMLIAEGDKDVLSEPILDNLLVRPERQIAHAKEHQLTD